MSYCISITAFPLFALASLVGPTDDDLVEQVAAGNAATLQLIESYYCNVLYTTSAKGQAGTPISEYWRTKNSVRIRESRPPKVTIDVRLDGGRSQQITTVSGQPPDPKNIGITIDESRRFGLKTDAWQLSLFDLPAMITRKPSLFIYSLSELIAKGTIKEAGWTRLDGNRVAHLLIELQDEGRSYELWIDPKLNWLVVKAIHTLKDAEGVEFWKIEHKIDETREIKPSLFVPISTSISLRMKGKMVGEEFFRFDEVRVNESLPAVPVMPIPPGGSLAVDLVEGTAYRIDGNGRRSSNLFRMGAETSGFADPPTRRVEPNPYRIWGWILGIAALAILLLALARRYITRST
jgi:hypothetical protein